LDFSPSRRLASDAKWFAAGWLHHQGMSLLSIANFLDDEILQRWFHSHPQVQATELLLQEKPASRMNSQKSRVKAA
jgi:cyclic beta-1,2-glucan synthetase